MADQLTVEQFFAECPEFDSSDFPVSSIEARLSAANHFFKESLWGTMRPHAMALYAAHFLSLQYGKNNAGGVGIVTSKSVDGASVSYDAATGSEEGAGAWNLTQYGRELFQLTRIYGMAVWVI